MTALTGDDLLARAEAALAVALPDALGLAFLDPADPTAGTVLTVSGLALTPAATLHASALGAAAELAGYLAVLPTLALDQHAVTHTTATQLLRPAPAGARVEVVGRLRRRARATAFVEVTATLAGAGDPADRVVALVQITKAVVAW